MGPIKRILSTTDLSACSFHALGYAIDFALRMEARLDVIHVLQSGGADSSIGNDQRRSDIIESQLRNKVRELLDTGYQTSVGMPKIHCETIRSEKVPSAIIDYAKVIGADMIILGTRGQGGVKRLFLGSVAEEVVRTARC